MLRKIPTPHGEVWLHAASDAAFDGERPVVLVILGAFSNAGGRFLDLERLLPVSVVVTATPGEFSPPVAETSVAGFARALDAALPLFAGRPLILCGESVGGLTALAAEAPGAQRLVLDPPLRTGKAWPIRSWLRELLSEKPERADFLWQVFGLSSHEAVDRDYTDLLSPPAHLIVGEAPLYPERVFTRIPSLVDEPERELMRGQPHLTLTVAPGAGHFIPGDAPQVFLAAVKERLARALAQ
ncbi:MAG: alpha/beta hydrolase [Proteobacteria bacterium]|nr:alpha/beta hydrolase [Pseudomonadota bacterium]